MIEDVKKPVPTPPELVDRPAPAVEPDEEGDNGSS
jgi:hypothetical protein